MEVKGNFMSRQEVEKLHEATLYVLSRVGVKFEHEYALKIFADHGARVEGNTVYIDEGLLNKAMASIPESFVLRGRESGKEVHIGGAQTVFAPASGPVFVMQDNHRRFAGKEDLINFIKLVEASSTLDIVNPNILEPQDVPSEERQMFQIAACLKYSAKPLMGITSGEAICKQSIELIAKFYGAKQENMMLGVISPISPLVYDTTMVNAIIDFATEGQPLLFASCSLPGGTSPVTICGTLAIDNAEVLAGIILSQLIKPGLPVIYGNTSTACDLRYTSPAIGSPETGLITFATSALSKYYGIPCRSGGALSDSKTVDIQAGIESTFTLLPAMMAGIDFMLQSCGILESFGTLSYEKFIIDQEIIGLAKRFISGFRVEEELLGLKMIEKKGPGSHFLEERHTFDHYRDELYIPRLFSREGYEQWISKGAQTICDVAKSEVEKRLGEYEAPYIGKEQGKILVEYIQPRERGMTEII